MDSLYKRMGISLHVEPIDMISNKKIHSILMIILFFVTFSLYANQGESPVETPPVAVTAPEPVIDIFSEAELNEARKRIQTRDLISELLDAFRFNHSRSINTYLNELRNISGESAEYHYFQALSLYQSGEKAQSLSFLEKSVKINPSFDSSWNLMGLIYAEADRLDIAAESFNKAIEASPYNPTYNYNLASTQYRIGKKELALDIIEDAIAMKLNFSDAYYLKGLILRDSSSYEEALTSFEHAFQYGLESKSFLLEYLRLAESVEKDSRALELCEALSSYNDAEILRIHGRLRSKYGEFNRAHTIYQNLLKQNGANLQDKKSYLYVVSKIGRDPMVAFYQMNVSDEEKPILLDYIKQLKENRRLPGVKDPIVNPVR